MFFRVTGMFPRHALQYLAHHDCALAVLTIVTHAPLFCVLLSRRLAPAVMAMKHALGLVLIVAKRRNHNVPRYI